MTQKITLTLHDVDAAPVMDYIADLLNPMPTADRAAHLLTVAESAARAFGHRLTVVDTPTTRQLTMRRQD